MSRISQILIACSASLLLGLAACKSHKTVSDTGTAAPKNISKREGMKLYGSLIDAGTFQYYAGKARLKARTPDTRVSATLHLRIVRDSVVWATIDKIGFEVARILITPDSVFVVDRLNKEFTAEALEPFLSEFGVTMDFADLQQTLVGNVIALQPVELVCVRETDCDVLMIKDPAGVTAQYWVAHRKPQRLMKSHFVDHLGRKLSIENLQWTELEGNMVPFLRLLTFEDSDGLTEIEMAFTEITLNEPASLPFSIPGHYAKAR